MTDIGGLYVKFRPRGHLIGVKIIDVFRMRFTKCSNPNRSLYGLSHSNCKNKARGIYECCSAKLVYLNMKSGNTYVSFAVRLQQMNDSTVYFRSLIRTRDARQYEHG